jgi:multidrug efflux pump
MILSDISVKRPVFASVLSLLLVTFGIVAYERLPVREYPDVDPPVVSIETNYRGAAANVVESRITQIIEDRVAGIEGIRFIESSSEDGRSTVNIEFNVQRDIDAAANDVRDRVSTLLNDLPVEADPPEIQKVNANEDVILWLNLTSERLTVPELTDYAERYLVDRFSVIDGVARVRIGGGQRYAMRVWLDRTELAARNLTVADVERALRAENLELPAGNIESEQLQFTVRVERRFRTVRDFKNLVMARGRDGHLIRLGDLARVEKGTEEERTLFRGNGVAMVGVGIVKQSTANTIAVARGAKSEAEKINRTLPAGMKIEQSYDSSVFVERAMHEVYLTLFIAMSLVILVIYLFLGSIRAVIVPAVTVPVSLISTFIVLYSWDFSINLLTLLSLVLAIGLVVDDAIVVLENIHRRMKELGETPLIAAFNGTREVSFAVISTTLVLVAVFLPLAFLQGDIGRLFSEFALTMAAALGFSSFVALSLSPMLASKLLHSDERAGRIGMFTNTRVDELRDLYSRFLVFALRRRFLVMAVFCAMAPVLMAFFYFLPSEYVPREDRGAFFIMITGPEGASHSYMKEYMLEIENRLMPIVESGEASRLLLRSPRSFGLAQNFNTGIAILVLEDWGKRRSAWEIMAEVREQLVDLPGVRASAVMRQGFRARGAQKPVQFVIGGGTYEELAEWREIILGELNRNNPGIVDLDWDYKETKPQFEVHIDYDRAAELGITIENIGRSLETMLGSRRVTTFIESGEEYDVIVEGERSRQNTPADMKNIYVRSSRTQELIPLSNLITFRETAGSTRLNRYNRLRSITLEGGLSRGYPLGSALEYLQELVRERLPSHASVDYKGESKDYRDSSRSIAFIFILGLLTVFLVLAAQFESYIHPLIIILSVPVALLGGVLGLFLSGNSLNLYSQVALVMLVGLAAKNGILIVEFANQLRDKGMAFDDALTEASLIRLRPILMTGITTIAGSLPLIFTSGAGAETRQVIGFVVFSGVSMSIICTVFLVPVAYSLLARHTGSAGDVARRLELEG